MDFIDIDVSSIELSQNNFANPQVSSQIVAENSYWLYLNLNSKSAMIYGLFLTTFDASNIF